MASHIASQPPVVRLRPARELVDRLPTPDPIRRPPGQRLDALRSLPGRVTVRPSVPSFVPHFGAPPEDWLARRWKHIQRLVRLDSPLAWRLAAHASVVGLAAAVLGLAQLSTLPGAAAAGSMTDTGSRFDRWTLSARGVVPSSLVGISGEPSAARAITTLDQPGFVSPGAIAEAQPSLLPWDAPESYRVARGDTVTSIAARFGIEPLWLLFSNPGIRDKPHELKVGRELIVYPMQAVVHQVEDGDTISSVAETYEADPSEIVAYSENGLENLEQALISGQDLVIPEGQMELEIPSYYDFIVPRANYGGWASAPAGGGAVGTGQFYVASYGRRTQGWRRGHLAVDLAAPTGTPIYAIDSGVVAFAGWYGWAGWAVIIDHQNGYQSLYAHMSRYDVDPGVSVQRGQVIGGIGCTRGRGGRCTGPHLHLEVRLNGAPQNPCSIGACP